MMRYADPHACPGCRGPIAATDPQCPTCGLSLRGEPAREVFTALAYADTLVARLRAAAPSPSPWPSPSSPPSPPSLSIGPATGTPLTAPVTAAARGLSGATVPKVLLSLGALCLLVAALVFLAVAWARLDVHGRTLVLIGITAACGALAGVVARRGLRAGAESLASVALGLVAVDVAGASDAGWLGEPRLTELLLVLGVAIAVPATATTLLARRTPVGTLLAPELFAIGGTAVATLGLANLPSLHADAGVLLAVLAAAGAAVVARLLELRVAAPAVAVLAAVWWLALVGRGVANLPVDLSVADVWLSGAAWLLVVAAVLPVPVAVARSLPLAARVVAASAAVAVGTGTLALVSFDESRTVLSLVELAVVAAALVVGLRLAGAWRAVVVLPSAAAGLGLAAGGLALVAVAVDALLDITPWGEDLAAGVGVPDLSWSWPLLLPAAGLAVLAAGWLAARCLLPVSGRVTAAWATPVAITTVALVPTLYGVPRWVALLALAAGLAAVVAAAAVRARLEPLAGAAVLGVLLLLGSLASPWSTAATLAVLSAVAAVAMLRRDPLVTAVGGVVLPLAGSGLLWTVQHLAGVTEPWRGVAVLVALGVLLVARPGVLREVPSYVAGSLVVAACVLQPTGLEQGWLAVHLTLGGVALTVVSLVHEHRRQVGWGGLALLTAAQWVRLSQLGVDTVEAYTLPLAAVLLAVGLVRLHRTDVSSLRALGAGLSLALVPTLLLVLLEPVSVRALALGAGCAVTVGVGAATRWSAPLVAGASVGAVLVLREAQHASVLPQWMTIGLVGLLLTVVGITWEQRLAEIRAAAGYVRRLR